MKAILVSLSRVGQTNKGQGELKACREPGISRQTFYFLRNKYGGMEISDVLKFKAIEEENRKLKRLVVDLSLNNQVLKDIIEKNF